MKRLWMPLLLLLAATSAAYAQDKPNIVLILMDNLGYGELGVYGGGVLPGRQHRALTSSPAKGYVSSTST